MFKLRFNLSLISKDELDSCIPQIESDGFPDDDLQLALRGSITLDVVDGQDSGGSNLLNDIVVSPDQPDYTNLPQILKLIEKRTAYLKAKHEQRFVSPGREDQIYLEDTMSAKITVFHVMLDKTESNAPTAVVLNFTGTENFFHCTQKGKEMALSITTYEKKKLQNSTRDPIKQSLVFFMKQMLDGSYNFESALHRGWFFIANTDIKMKQCSAPTVEKQFTFIN